MESKLFLRNGIRKYFFIFLYFPNYLYRTLKKTLSEAISELTRYFCFLFFVFFTSLLEYNCFTMVCQFLLYNKVNQLYIYICPHISSLLHLPPSHPPYPTPLSGHKAPSRSPCAMRLLPASYLFYVW